MSVSGYNSLLTTQNADRFRRQHVWTALHG